MSGAAQDAEFLLAARGAPRDLGAWVVAVAWERGGACGFGLGDGTVRLARPEAPAEEWASAAAHEGGACLSMYYSVDSLINNSFYDNNANLGTFTISYHAYVKILNNIVAFNQCAGLAAVQFGAYSADFNDVFANAGGDYSGINPGHSSISVDPAWSDTAASDLRLTMGSPCVDAGLPFRSSTTRMERGTTWAPSH